MKNVLSKVGLDVHTENILLALITPHKPVITGTQRELISFSKLGEQAITKSRFCNWKKSLEKFKAHHGSHYHKKAK